MNRFLRYLVLWSVFGALLTACNLQTSEPQVIYVTATLSSPGGINAPVMTVTPVPRVDLSPVPDVPLSQPTADPARFIAGESRQDEYVVQAGDNLYGIAQSFGTSLDALLAVNAFDDPNNLYVGQVISLPPLPVEQTPDFKILPDIRLIRGPGSASFDVAAFVREQPGYIRLATDTVTKRQADGTAVEQTLTAADVVSQVALEYSVDPRLLLALLEFRAGWLSNPVVAQELQTHPMISEEDSGDIDRSGLYRQLTWTADRLNYGYYGWKFRGWTTLEFSGEDRLLYAPGLNAGTVGVQYFLSLFTPHSIWTQQVSANGFYRIYFAYFGDPFADAFDPVVPASLVQPDFTLPFQSGEVWFFTGGAHGGWNSGSAWAAVDFAPPGEPPPGVACYTSEYWARAVAPGVIARSDAGAVVLDLDGDGDESTGWTVFYLHLASDGRVAAGTQVNIGDAIGKPACEGGFSTATHLHIARRYNGEWLPSECLACTGQHQRPPFVMSGWQVVALQNQEYQGFLDNGVERRVAEQGRLDPMNRISW